MGFSGNNRDETPMTEKWAGFCDKIQINNIRLGDYAFHPCNTFGILTDGSKVTKIVMFWSVLRYKQ
jgi:hypothetical protein